MCSLALGENDATPYLCVKRYLYVFEFQLARWLSRGLLLVLFFTMACQMTKLKELGNASDALYSRRNNSWIGRVQRLTGSVTVPVGDIGQERVL